MGLPADAVDSGLLAEQTAPWWQAQFTPSELATVRCINVEVDQAGSSVAGFQRDGDLFDRPWRMVDQQNGVMAEGILPLFMEDGLGEMIGYFLQRPGKQGGRTRRGFLGSRQVER